MKVQPTQCKLGYGGTQSEMQRLLADAEAFSGVHYDIDNLGDVYDAIHVIQGELGLTGVAAGEASTSLTGSMEAVKASWENVMGAMTTGEGLDVAMESFTASVGNFANNVFSMLTALGGQLPELIHGLARAVIDNAPAFLRSGIELIIELGLGLVEAIPEIIGMIPSLFMQVVEAILNVDWLDVGWNIIQGIIVGIWNAAGGLWEAMKGIAQRAWQSAKENLGIASPSKVFADEVGRWIPAGIAEGIDDNLAPMDQSVDRMALSAVSDLDQATRSGPAAPAASETPGDLLQLIQAIRDQKYEFYLDGKQITDCVTIRQRRAARSGGVA